MPQQMQDALVDSPEAPPDGQRVDTQLSEAHRSDDHGTGGCQTEAPDGAGNVAVTADQHRNGHWQPSAPEHTVNGGSNGVAADGQPSRDHQSVKGSGHGGKGGPTSTAVQDTFLNGLRRENIDVVIYFLDGSQERGVVRA